MSEDNARLIFNRAYSREYGQARLTDDLFRIWLGTIKHLSYRDGYTHYIQTWQVNYLHLKQDDSGATFLNYSARSLTDLRRAGLEIGLESDTEAGVVARALVAIGGPALLDAIHYEFNSDLDRGFFAELSNLQDRSRRSLLDFAQLSDPGQILERLLGYEAQAVSPPLDVSLVLPDQIYVSFNSHENTLRNLHEHLEMEDSQDEQKDER